MKLGTTLRTIKSSQGGWHERRSGCAMMKPLKEAQDTYENHGDVRDLFMSPGPPSISDRH